MRVLTVARGGLRFARNLSRGAPIPPAMPAIVDPTVCRLLFVAALARAARNPDIARGLVEIAAEYLAALGVTDCRSPAVRLGGIEPP